MGFSRLWCGVLAVPLVFGLSGCSPEPPGFVAVGKDDAGRLVGVMVSCSDPADRAVLARLDQHGDPAGPSIAEWTFPQHAETGTSPLVWPMFGPSANPSGPGVSSTTGLPDGALALSIQRDPENGATGVDFTAKEIEGLSGNQYAFHASNTQEVTHGDLKTFLKYADCG
ncbi:hypothetical protein GCM10009867_16370 [Pedococcus aerophilus]|uniref:Uncharacterized protein n=1 Tax=Pedococcus aerophilus TaxID=436356 RepID=A0ABN3ULE7_9MICO